jgi:hypothetical protein
LNGEKFVPVDRTKRIEGLQVMDLRQLVHRDFAPSAPRVPTFENDVARARIVQLENDRWLEKRDIELTIEILKRTGKLGAPENSSTPVKSDENVDGLLSIIDSPSFFTTFVLEHLVEMLNSPVVFDAVTWIFVRAAQFALPFLGQVIAGFVQEIDQRPNDVLLSNQLELIV